MKDNKSNVLTQKSLFPTYSSIAALRQASAEYDKFTRTRLSKNFILRDFLYSSDSDFRGICNLPNDKEMVVKAGKALCQNILEPVTEKFGKPFITFGYQSKEGIEADWSPAKRKDNPRSSSPHMWDRNTHPNKIYCRVDILPACVEDGEVSKSEFGKFLMYNLDIDLLMTFKRSNIFCITYSEYLRRRIWVDWGSPSKGEPKREDIIGTEFWRNIYPNLPEELRPKYGPSCTGGSMQWGSTRK
jgi:hypothetical protein